MDEGDEPGLVSQLRAEIERLSIEVGRLRAEADRLAAERSVEDGEHRFALEKSRAATAQAHRDRRTARRDALEVESRYARELATTTSDLLSSEELVAQLRTSEAARQEAERRQEILNQELSHRLKNTLNMVLAIASQTLKNVTEKDAVAAFRARLMALSTAHDVLLQQSWTAAPLDGVASKVLAVQADLGRFDLSGPRVELAPKGVLSLSLLLHELATNAIKYGALSTEGGRVGLSWTVDGAGSAGTLSLIWRESDGPPVVKPGSSGFGSRLILSGLGGPAETILRYDPDGLLAEFRSPLALVAEA